MARFDRASLLLSLALGVALSMPPATAAAANGGAAPTSTLASDGGSAGGAAAGAAPAGAPKATSAGTGGAVPGHKPPVRRRPVRHQPKPRPKPKTHQPAPKPPRPMPSVPTVSGVFPVAGPFTFGGSDARFGAQRSGHIHQGQDVVAANGTPLRAPVSGTVLWTGNQKGGAGIYLVVHGADGRDYVLMHLREHTLSVSTGKVVHAGEQVGEVGATGDASGPHLHFEIWVGGWGTKTGQPVDPLPQLRRWAGLRA